ncbi:hypothetical protein [Natronohydrobacter thiooxidans]|uniref:hypothetical protein n=1 Tax=Natronohydrobacter thiooxidans TaxID=87172 RepID=UPI000AED09C4|nr:hypothetical protein [Natronohydrobacter thiooxidans]
MSPQDGGGRVSPAPMRLVRMGLHSQGEPVAMMRADCHVCRSEGLHARAWVEIESGGRRVTARLLPVEGGGLNLHEIGLSENIWARLGAVVGDAAVVRSAPSGRWGNSGHARAVDQRSQILPAQHGLMHSLSLRRYWA